MQLYEKLAFLLNLTQTTNRMLARELQVDASLISRLKTGVRGLPRNRDQIRDMAFFFAKHCATGYQRQALSDILDIKQVLSMGNEQLTEVLYNWLCGDTMPSGHFIRSFEALSGGVIETGFTENALSLNMENAIYYGNDGKRSAALAVYQHLLSLEKPGDLYLFTDESDDWISESYEFPAHLQNWGVDLLNRGFHFYHIAPPATSVDQAFESLNRWLPVYATGQVSAFYYPRLRDNVHRRTLIVMPGQIAMTSASVAHHTSGYATILTTDQRLTQIYGLQFQDYLSLCRPLLKIHTSADKLMQCMTQFLSSDGGRIQKVTGLSAETAPPELVADCAQQAGRPDLAKLGRFYFQEAELIEKNRETYKFIDIARLADAEAVRAGIVPITLTYGAHMDPLYYTPDSYALHLKNILHIMETCENYHFIPTYAETDDDTTLLVKEGGHALLVRTTPPLMVFEISQPDLIHLCREQLFQVAERSGYLGTGRAKTMSRIRALIRELQS